MQWRIPPQYGTNFSTHVDGSLYIHAADGKEMDVYGHMIMALEAERQRSMPPPKQPDVSDAAALSPDTTKDIKDSP